MILSNTEFMTKVEETKDMFRLCSNRELIDMFNTYSMAYALHEGDDEKQSTELLALEALWELIENRMK